MGNIVALNAAGGLREVQEVLEFGEGAVGGNIHKLLVGKDDFLLEFLETVELLTESGGSFVVLGVGGGAHLLFKLAQKFVAAALKVEAELAEILLVFLGGGFADFNARGETEVGV